MPATFNSSYPFTLSAIDGTTTAAYLGITNTDLNTFGSVTLNVPSAVTITFSVTWDTVADSTSTWTQIETGITNKVYNYADSTITGFKVTRTAGSATIKGAVSGIGGGGGVGTSANPSEVALVAGTALAGKFGIDQVTSNANEVVVKSITAGTNLLGKVSIDQVTANANEVVVKSGTVTTVSTVTTVTNPVTTKQSYSFANMATNTTTTHLTGAGIFHGITVNTGGTTSTATVYDNTAGSGTLIGTFATTAVGAVVPVDAAVTTGITVTTAGAAPADITVLWRT